MKEKQFQILKANIGLLDAGVFGNRCATQSNTVVIPKSRNTV